MRSAGVPATTVWAAGSASNVGRDAGRGQGERAATKSVRPQAGQLMVRKRGCRLPWSACPQRQRNKNRWGI